MKLNSKILKAVTKAFEVAGDLKKVATLRSSDNLVYNFNTGSYDHLPTVTTVEVLLPSAEAFTNKAASVQLLVKGADLDGNHFTTITVDGKNYRIESFQKTMDFLYVITVRGGNV